MDGEDEAGPAGNGVWFKGRERHILDPFGYVVCELSIGLLGNQFQVAADFEIEFFTVRGDQVYPPALFACLWTPYLNRMPIRRYRGIL